MVITATKPMDMPVKYFQLMDIVSRLDIYVKPLSFPWRPGDLSCWCLLCNDECVCAPVDVRAHAVPGVQRDVHCRLQEVLYGCGVASSQVLSPSVSLLDTTNLDLNEEEVDNMPEDQTASAETLMVLLTLLSQAEVFFPGERVYYSLLRLKLFPQEQPTLSVKGGAPNPYLSPEKFVDKVF